MSRCIISGWPALMFCISVCVFFLLSSFGNGNNVGGGGEGRDGLARKRKGTVLVKIISEFQQNAQKFTLPKEHAHTRRCTSHCSGIAVMVQGHLRQAHTGALY